MRSILTITLLLLTINSCSQKKNTSQTPFQVTVSDSGMVSTEINSDVVVDTLIEIKKIGAQILDGKMISNFDEKDIYKLIHLVTTPDSNDRKFFFKVFNSIKGQAREYMAQEVDDYSDEFLRTLSQ